MCVRMSSFSIEFFHCEGMYLQQKHFGIDCNVTDFDLNVSLENISVKCANIILSMYLDQLE